MCWCHVLVGKCGLVAGRFLFMLFVIMVALVDVYTGNRFVQTGVLWFLFFGSGCVMLIYELVWF